MKLDEVEGGSIYVDTNVFYMYLRAAPAHLSILTAFFGRMVRGAIEAFVGIPVLDELFYRLLLARVRDATGRNPLEVLREDLVGVVAAHGDMVDMALRKLVTLPHLHLVGVETADFYGMLDNIRTWTKPLLGAPIAHEDSPRRAVHAALGRQRAIRDFSRELQAQRGFGLQMRIGINTGLVVVGKIGDDLRMDIRR
jgi:class 3 adenylate cyclase